MVTINLSLLNQVTVERTKQRTYEKKKLSRASVDDVPDVGFFEAWNTTSQVLKHSYSIAWHGVALPLQLIAAYFTEYSLPILGFFIGVLGFRGLLYRLVSRQSGSRREMVPHALDNLINAV